MASERHGQDRFVVSSHHGGNEVLGLRDDGAYDPIEGAVSIQQLTVRQRVIGCFRCDSCQAPNIAVATGFLGTDDPLVWLAKKKNKDWVPKPARTVRHDLPRCAVRDRGCGK